MNLKEYDNNWYKIRRRCHWITISDFMPVKDITERDKDIIKNSKNCAEMVIRLIKEIQFGVKIA